MLVEVVDSPDEMTLFRGLTHGAPLHPESPAMQQADRHLLLRSAPDAEPVARCSLWWTHAPAWPARPDTPLGPGPGRLGCIGHFAATPGADPRPLLDLACALLAEQGCTVAVGPLDGNTFRAYRFVTRSAVDGLDLPPFLLEPQNPPWWPEAWQAAGFAPLAGYVSAVAPLPEDDPRMAQLQARVAAHAIRIRPVDLDDFSGELARIYAVVVESFRDNFLYSPISLAEFSAQYAVVAPYLQAPLILLAEQGERTVGFIFALPDLAQAHRGQTVDTVILKTVAVTPDVGGLGLGGLLVAQVQQTARAMGLRRAIHALMVEDNNSRRISRRYARVMREYVLFARPLAGHPGKTDRP